MTTICEVHTPLKLVPYPRVKSDQYVLRFGEVVIGILGVSGPIKT
jgi:hypothetical protein